jgi:phosphotransferase system IIA component
MDTLTLKVPLSGYLMQLERVPDPVFAQKMAGDGIAVDSVIQTLFARAAGVNGIMKLADRTPHLLVGLNADQYAAEMQGQLAQA